MIMIRNEFFYSMLGYSVIVLITIMFFSDQLAIQLIDHDASQV